MISSAKSPSFNWRALLAAPFVTLPALVTALLAVQHAHAETAPLTLEMAVRHALHRSAAHQAAQSATQASAEAAAQAGQLPDPMLKLGIDNLPVEGPDRWSLSRDFMTMRRIGIEQSWVSADKRAARSARAGQIVALQQAEAAMHAADTRAEAALAWIQMRHAQRAQAFATELAKHAGDDLAAVQAAHRGGKASAADVTQAQLALTRAQDGRARAAQALDTARIALQRWVQVPVESVDEALPPLTLPAAMREDGQLDQHHPLLLKSARASELAESDVIVAKTERQQDWRFELAFSQRSSPYANMLSFGVTIPLTVNPSQRQDRSIGEKAAQATAARLQQDETRRMVAAELAALQAATQQSSERATWLREQALPLARQAVDLAVAAYRSGGGGLSAVFNARRMLVEQQLQIAELERDAALAWAQLSFPLQGDTAATQEVRP